MSTSRLLISAAVILTYTLSGISLHASGLYLHAHSSKMPEYSQEIIVKFKQNVSESEIAAINSKNNAVVVRRLKQLRMYILRLPANVDARRVAELYSMSPHVEYAEPNYIFKIQSMPDDPKILKMWNMKAINAPEAWSIETGSSNVVVAVIDTGVDVSHEDLSANLWINPSEICGDGVDNDGNGYVDDCHGINTVDGSTEVRDDNGHGTHVSGIIGAVGDNGIGVAGVNWKVSIMVIKAFDSSGSGTLAGVLQGIDYVLQMRKRGVNIIATSNSYVSSSYSRALEEAVEELMKAGILFVAAAGNAEMDLDRVRVYPASYDVPAVISVASANRDLELSGFSNYGAHTVHIAAPGESILSTLPGDSYGYLSGTSMAAPHVAGLAALLKAYNRSFDWRGIKNLILAGGAELESLQDVVLSGRMVDAYGALTCDSSALLAVDKPAVSYSEPGKKLMLRVTSINCSMPLQVDVRITDENNRVYRVPIKDDGVYPDRVAGDGVFTAFWAPPAEGLYRVVFDNGVLEKEVRILAAGRRTLVVTEGEECTDGDAIYRSIQDAVINAAPGDEIVVCPGVYEGPVKVDKALEIRAYPEKAEDVEIRAEARDGAALKIYSSGTNISGFRIYGEGSGVSVVDSSHVKITENAIYGGVRVYSSSNVLITENRIENGEYGMLVSDSWVVNITENEISGAVRGVVIQRSSDVTMRSNHIEDNYVNFGVYGYSIGYFMHDIDISNDINDRPLLYLVNEKNMVIDADTNAGFVGIVNSKNVSVIGLNITNNTYGVLVAYSDGVVLHNITSYRNEYGVYMFSSNSTTVRSSLIHSNYRDGIGVYYSSNVRIYSNSISKNVIGVHIAYSTGNTIAGNSVTENKAMDVYVDAASPEHCSNTLENNTGSGNREIGYLRSSENLKDVSLSELLLCDSDGSSVENVNVTGSSRLRNNGIVAILTDNITVSDVVSTGNLFGIYMEQSSSNSIFDSEFNGNMFGIFLKRSSDNVMSANHIDDNDIAGVVFWRSHNNTLTSSILSSNGKPYGHGIMISSGSGNLIFNNLLNNTQNVEIAENAGENLWNVDVHAGYSIVGGDVVGGNYWASPKGRGYSDTCEDADENGICDTPYVIARGNIDHAPLAAGRGVSLKEMPGYAAAVSAFTSFLSLLLLPRLLKRRRVIA